MEKVAFIDVDGTLTSGLSSWEKVHHYFGLEDEMKANSKRYFSGEIDYNEWAKLDVSLWKGKKVDEIHNAVNPPELIQGAAEGIAKLKENGYKVILLSGGIDIMVNEVANLVNADDAHSNIIEVEDGYINGLVGVTVGIKGKVIRELKNEQNIDLNQSIAMGDNFNDIDMFELVGKSLAVNPKSDDLIEVATDTIHTDDFEKAVDKILDL